MHELESGGEVGSAIAPFDRACLFTPRALVVSSQIQPNLNEFVGEIRIYRCTQSEEEEALAARDRGAPEKSIHVQKLRLSDDKNELEIVATILGAAVTYHLTRSDQGVAAENNSREDGSAKKGRGHAGLILASKKSATAGKRNIASSELNPEEQQGSLALKELGFDPDVFTRRDLREAGLLKVYQRAWNDFDPKVTDPAKIANPDNIISHYTDGAGLLYRDMCVPSGITTKDGLKQYLSALYSKAPKQIWGNGWKSIRLFKGAAPGEWSYYYDFEMYKTAAPNEKPYLTGTGMERVTFDTVGKLISDEIHLILTSGSANCRFEK